MLVGGSGLYPSHVSNIRGRVGYCKGICTYLCTGTGGGVVDVIILSIVFINIIIIVIVFV